VVSYLEGDPDRPLITGVVYNADQMPAYPLPAEKTKSWVKTNSTKGGDGFNEIRFEDKKDKEQIFMHAERNMDVRVKNDSMERIFGDRHQIIGWEKDGGKGGDQRERVYQDKHLNIKRNQVEHIEGNMQLLIGKGDASDGGNMHVVVEKNKHELIEEHNHLHIKMNDSEQVDGVQSLTVGGDKLELVKGKNDLEVKGDRSEKVGGAQSLTVGGDQQEKVGMNHALEAGMAIHIKAGMTAVIEAGMQLSLKVGGSFIDINPTGISISGPMVLINSGGAAGSGAGSNPTEPSAPAAPEDPEEASPTEPTLADDSKTGKKSAPDSLS
jgi:type VI secretion system secreted protein VgrG